MKKISQSILFALLLITLVAPALSFAQTADEKGGLVQCGRALYGPGEHMENGVDFVGTVKPCQFDDFLSMINRIINFILKVLVVPLAAIMFAYAGATMLIGGSEGRTKAKGIFLNVIIGLVISVAAWLIVKTLLTIIGYQDIHSWFK